MHHKIISLGEVLWDLFPEGARFGGAPANFACHAAALGADVTMISAVGQDAYGTEAVEILKRYGIHTDLIQTLASAPTGTVGIELDENAKPTFTIHEGAAWDQLVWSKELEQRIQGANAIYFGTLGQRSEISREVIRRVLDSAAALGVPRILDVNLRAPFYNAALIRESVSKASLLKLSDDELPEVCSACSIPMANSPESSLSELRIKFDLDLVVMTRGAEGAMLVLPNETIEQAGIPAVVRDTVGAGDSFTAAFVMGLLQGETQAVILHDACKLAAKVCSQVGAVPDPNPSGEKPLSDKG